MRYAIVIVGLLVLVGALGAVKGAQIASLVSFGKKAQEAGPPPESVSTAHAETTEWQDTMTAVGSITPVRGVALSNDAPGVVTKLSLESGAMVKAGQTLLELDTSVERAQLASAQARVDLANVTASRTRALVESGSIARAQLDTDEAARISATKDLDAIKAQIERKTVRAPFAGRLGLRNVNLGQYLNPGTPIASLEAIDQVYVDFSLPQQRLAKVTVGMPVRVTLAASTTNGDGGAPAVPPVDGTVSAIDPEVDSTTRAMKLRAAIPNKGETLRPGMFANVTILLPHGENQVIVPVTALVHAAYGDSVFIVEDKPPKKTVRQQFVRPGESRGDFVAIEVGVAPGQEIVTAGAFKLRNGSAIVIDNSVQAKPELQPHPANR